MSTGVTSIALVCLVLGSMFSGMPHAASADTATIYVRDDYRTIRAAVNNATAGMISYWTFDEGGGTTAFDLIGTNHGAVYGATRITGIVDGALSFDGVDDYVKIPDSNSLDISDAITIEAWVKPTFPMPALETEGIVFKRNSTGTSPVYGLYGVAYPAMPLPDPDPLPDQLPVIRFQIFSEDMGVFSPTPTDPLPIDEWSHVVGTYQRNTMRIYLNGMEQGSLDVRGSGVLEINNEDVYIGLASWSLTGYFNGAIDEVAIYSRTLSVSEIQQHYQNGLKGLGYLGEHVSLPARAADLAKQVVGKDYHQELGNRLAKGWGNGRFLDPSEIEYLDCSGLVFWAYNKAGGTTTYDEYYPIHVGAEGQWEYNVLQMAQSTPEEELRPGDMLFFDWNGDGWTDHVEMYVGLFSYDGQIKGTSYSGVYDVVNASSPGYGIIPASLSTERERSGFLGFGRYTVSSQGATVSATGTGIVSFLTSTGGVADVTAISETSLPIVGKPNVTFPHGLFSFNITGIADGSTVTVTITLPSAVPVGTQYWKCQGGTWVNCTSLLGDDDGDNVLTLTLTDGGLGDSDGLANGTIVDPGGPGVPATPGPTPAMPEGASTGGQPSPVRLTSPDLSLKYLNVNPQQAHPNQPVTILTNVVNRGGMAGSTNVILKINGQVEHTRTVTVGPYVAHPVRFTVYRSQPGSYAIEIGGQKGNFTIVGSGGQSVTTRGGPIIAIASFVVVVLIGLLLIVPRRRFQTESKQ